MQNEDMPAMATKIMEAGLELFAQKGYAATSVREIVRHAEVTNPMLYYYFDNKEGLFHHLVECLFSSMYNLVRGAIAGVEGAEAKLFAIARAQIEAARGAPVALQFVYGILFGPREGRPAIDVYALHFEMMAEVLSIMVEGIESGALRADETFDATFLSNQFMGMVNDHMMRALTLADSLVDDEVREKCLDEFLSREHSDRLVAFFLRGAGNIKST